MNKTLLVTGGAGFIGSALVHYLHNHTNHVIVNVDKLTYAGHLASLESLQGAPRYHFEHVDIGDAEAVGRLFQRYRPDAVLHLAAESHVDRSIDGPAVFLETNVAGTFTLLESARSYWQSLAEERRKAFRFLHVSTDEVFGALGSEGRFSEETAYDPRSPYSASKAASDHFVRAWYYTYGLPILITNCSNNYGPRQHPEKLIPTVILRAASGMPIPVYGNGRNVRDWLFVEDHVLGLLRVLEAGKPGETYAIGARYERSNLEVVTGVCSILDDMHPAEAPHERLITFVEDRPGHDFRYAIEPSKVESRLGWTPMESFESGLRKTVKWYLENPGWCESVLGGESKLERLGLAGAK